MAGALQQQVPRVYKGIPVPDEIQSWEDFGPWYQEVEAKRRSQVKPSAGPVTQGIAKGLGALSRALIPSAEASGPSPALGERPARTGYGTPGNRPALPGGGPVGPAPATGAAPAGGAPAAPGGALPVGDIDPDVGRKVAKDSYETVQNTAPRDRKAIYDQLEDTFGKNSVEDSFNKVMDSLDKRRKERQAERDANREPVDEDEGKFSIGKMSKEDKGLFLMDFGMRLMAHSGQWNAQLGGAIGQAGSEALGGAQDKFHQDYAIGEERRRAALEEERFDEELARDDERSALDIAQMQVQQQGDREKMATDIMLSREGFAVDRETRGRDPTEGLIQLPDGSLWDMNRGDYAPGPGGKPLKGTPFGGSAGRDPAAVQLRDSLVASGWDPAAAENLSMGGKTDSEALADATRMFNSLVQAGGKIPIGGKLYTVRQLPESAQQLFIDEHLARNRAALGSRIGGPALQDDGQPRDDDEFDVE